MVVLGAAPNCRISLPPSLRSRTVGRETGLLTRYVVVFAVLACVVPGSGRTGTTAAGPSSLWGIAPSEAAAPDTAALKKLQAQGVNALVLDVQRLGGSKTAVKRIDSMRVLAGSLKMSLVLLVPQRGGPTPAFAHVLKLCRGTTVRCASLAPSVPAAIKLARATVKNRPLVAVYVSKPAMLAPLASLNALRRHILLIAPLYKTFNDQLWGSVIAAAAASPAIDLAVAPVSTVGSPSVQRFGAALSTSGSTAGAGPDVTAPSAPSVSVVGVTASSAGVWWLPSVDDVGVAAYRLYVGGALFDGHGTSPETIGNLPCGVPVTIGVDAVDAAGNASAQSSVTATPGPCAGETAPVIPPGDTTAPSTPAGVSVSGVSQSAVTLSWSASTDDVGVAGYRLSRDGSQVGTTGTTSFAYSGLTCGTTYTLGVAAVDAAGNSSGTATANVATTACPPPPPPDTTPPSTPTGLATSAVGQTSATLSWTGSTDDVGVTGYRLFRDGSQVGTSATTSYGYTGLTCGTTYTLGVAAVDAAGNVSGTATANVATTACPPPPPPDTTPPSTPTGLATSAIGQTVATLSWTASTDDVGVAGYRLFQDGSPVGTSTTTSFAYSSLSCEQSYTLGVAAVDSAGNVSGMATKSVTTTACPDTTPPSTPAGLATSGVGQTAATLTWTASTDSVGVTGYRVFRDGTQVGTPATTSFAYSGLTCGTTYTLGVAAVDAAGNVSGTATKSVTTTTCSDTIPPSTPTGLATSGVGQTGATLSWTASTDNVGVTGYQVFQGGTQVGTPATTSYGYTGLTCGTTYTLGVAAVDASGNVSGTATRTVTTAACPDTTPPSTPTGLATSGVSQTGATLSWTASTDNEGVTGYQVFRGGTQVGTPSATTYSFTGLTCGTTYTLGVAAVDAAGNVSGTATKTVTTTACPDSTAPSTPTGLATSGVGQTAATLTWTASTDSVGVTGYRVFRDGTQVGTPATTSFAYSGLTCGTTYTLGVAAVDAAANVSGTATKTVTTTACPDTTAPSTPTGLATSGVSQTGATLSWTASTDNVAVTGYRTFRGATQVGTPGTTSYAFTGLSCGTTYSLGVAAVDAAANASATATISVTTSACPDTTAPSTPTGLSTGTVGQSSVGLSWNAATDIVGVTGYRLFQNGSQVGTSISTSYIFGGLTCATTYTLGVAAVDGAGNVSGTASVPVTTAACPGGGGGGGSSASVFVAQSTGGTGDGSSCANARSATFFNTATNWGSTKTFAPGVTVGLCGTISSTLTAQGSGVSGSPITLVFQSGAKLEKSVCDPCLNLDNRSFIVVDGNNTGQVDSSANGTTLANHATLHGDQCRSLHELRDQEPDDRADVSDRGR